MSEALIETLDQTPVHKAIARSVRAAPDQAEVDAAAADISAELKRLLMLVRSVPISPALTVECSRQASLVQHTMVRLQRGLKMGEDLARGLRTLERQRLELNALVEKLARSVS